MEGISAEEQIPHVHARERIVEQSVDVIVPPIMVGISESEPNHSACTLQAECDYCAADY